MDKEIQNDLDTITKFVEELRENPKNISKVKSLESTVISLERHVENLYSGYYIANYEYRASFDYSSVIYEPLGYMTYSEACAHKKLIDIQGEELLDYGVKEVSKEQYRDFVHLKYLNKAYNALHELEYIDKNSYTNDNLAEKIIELREKLDVPIYVRIR